MNQQTLTHTWALPASPQAASLARSHVHQTCRRCRPDMVETARLLVSEVVTNAVQHGRGPVTLRATLTNEDLRVEVEDHDGALPTPAPLGIWNEHGRGLTIVEALAEEWGTEPAADAPGEEGKTVWFRLRR